MNNPLQLGLVIEGNFTNSAVLQLPSLAQELGPVKSASVRVARRFSNMLRAGYAVSEYEELEVANLVLLRLPDSAVPRVVDDLCASELSLKNLSFVLCESWLPAEALRPLSMRGASVATLLKVPTLETLWFVVEGELKAVRQTRRFLTRNRARSVELSPERKHLFFAAQLLATILPMSLLGAAQQTLRAAGISGNTLWTLLDQMTRKMLLDFSRGPRTDWRSALTDSASETRLAYLDTLRNTLPSISALLDFQLRFSWDGILQNSQKESSQAQSVG